MSEREARSYKKTLNLPETSFAMKANLVQREPSFQRRWERIDLYRRMLAACAQCGQRACERFGKTRHS